MGLPVEQAGHIVCSLLQLCGEGTSVASQGSLGALVSCDEVIPLLASQPRLLQRLICAMQLLRAAQPFQPLSSLPRGSLV